MMKTVHIITALILSLCLSDCTKVPEREEKDDTVFPSDGGGHPLVNKNGKVRFFVYKDGDASLDGYKVSVNGSVFDIKDDGKGHKCIDADYSPFNSYTAILHNPEKPGLYGSRNNKSIVVPMGQFSGKGDDFYGIPMFCVREEKDSIDILDFSSQFGYLDLELSGDERISSIHFESDTIMCGQFSFNHNTKKTTLAYSGKHINMNCTNGGNGTKASSAVYRFCMLTGKYKHIDVRICGMDKKVCFTQLENIEIKAGQSTGSRLAYSPDKDIAYYESFDNFVWGGDVMGGSLGRGWSPNPDLLTSTDGAELSGYEYGVFPVQFDFPGSGYIQIYSDADKNKEISQFHSMSESYCKSRNIMGYRMYRVQEFNGCIGLGVDAKLRPLFRTARFANLDGNWEGDVEFDYCFKENAEDNIVITMLNAGIISDFELDGKSLSRDDVAFNRCIINGDFIQSPKKVSKPSSASAAKSWHHIKFHALDLNASSRIDISPESANAIYHGFYLDNFKVTKTGRINLEKGAGVTRLILWNIQNGMWSGQGDNYDAFVNWVRKYEPDICVWCEAKSIYKFNGISGNLDYNNSNWINLAKRYGHNYAQATGSRVVGSGDNYPQEVTSTEEIRLIKNYSYSAAIVQTDGKSATKKSHGGGHVQIKTAGRTLNIIPLHLLPGVNCSSENTDKYQEPEYKSFIQASVLNKDYSDQTDWIVLGDHNCQNPKDKWFFDLLDPSAFRRYSAITWLYNNTDMVDIVRETNPDYFCRSTGGNGRIDFIFLSPALCEKVVNAHNIIDEYAISESPAGWSYSNPSDHRPVLVDFKF